MSKDFNRGTSSKKSVVLISHTYPPVLGGSEVEAQRVSAELIRRGNRVTVLCAGGAPMPPAGPWVDTAGIPVQILSSEREGRGAAIRFSIGIVWQLWLARRRADIAYFLMPGLHLAAGLPLASILGIKPIMKFSGSNTIGPLASSKAGRLELAWLRRFRIPVLVLNDGMIEEATGVGIPRDQLSLMPNPVDVCTFAPQADAEKRALRSRFLIPQDARVLVYTGRLSPEKGLVTLVEGFARAAAVDARLQLLLIGDGVQRAEIERIVAQSPRLSGQVRLVGRVEASEVPLWLQASDAFALVSPNEGFSCALSEAMAVGLPSVVSAIPANTQLVENGVQGLTVPVGDSESLSLAIGTIFADDALRVRMGEAARNEIVTKYSLDKVVDRYEALFDEIMERRR